MQQLQDQMKQVNKELADAKKKAAAANSEIPAAFNGAYGADLKPFPTKAPYVISSYILLCCVIGFLATLALKSRQAFDHTREYEDQETTALRGVTRPVAN